MSPPKPRLVLVTTLFLVTTYFYATVSATELYMQAIRSQLSNKTLFSDLITKEGWFPDITVDPHLDQIDYLYSRCNGIDIREITILQLQDLFAANKLTSYELTKCYIERIKKMNEVLRAVNEINPDALSQAARADLERKFAKPGVSLGLMHGIPILIKENMGTNDIMETTAGALAMIGTRPKNDAEVVKALRKAGAVIIGKANLSEWAYFRGTNVPSGWSGRGGQCRNAYSINLSPLGSSSGSAVAVTSNLAVVSLGTETDGSLIAPASVAGIFSLKPTHGSVSFKGIIPCTSNQDTPGPMARTVPDLAIALDAILPADQRHKNHPARFSQFILEEKVSRSFRIGVMRNPYFNISAIMSVNLEDTLPQLNEMIEILKNSVYFEVIDPLSPEMSLLTAVSGQKEAIVMLHDFKHEINEYLSNDVLGRPDHPIELLEQELDNSPESIANESVVRSNPFPGIIQNLEDVIEFNKEHPDPLGYNQDVLILSQTTDGIQNETYINARDENKAAAREVLDSLLVKYDLDAVMAPSNNWYEGLANELLDAPTSAYSLAAISGYPSANIPAGTGLKGVPIGMTIIGPPNTEGTLLQIAYQVERLARRRTKPKFSL